MYQHILLPTDGSELSGLAIRSGIQLAKSIGARVTGLYVIEESHVAAGIGKSLRKEEEPLETAKTFLAAITSAAKAAGVPCQCFHVTGEAAADQIVRTAAEKGLRSDLHGLARPGAPHRRAARERGGCGPQPQPDFGAGLPLIRGRGPWV